VITGQEISQLINSSIEGLGGYILGGAIGATIMALIGIIILISIGVYIYTSFALMTIAKKLKYKKAWLAWIPIANISMIYQIGGFHWAWVFLILVPVLGWIAIAVLSFISTWRIFEKLKYPGMLALVPILSAIPIIGWLASLAYLVILGIVAWKKR